MLTKSSRVCIIQSWVNTNVLVLNVGTIADGLTVGIIPQAFACNIIYGFSWFIININLYNGIERKKQNTYVRIDYKAYSNIVSSDCIELRYASINSCLVIGLPSIDISPILPFL